MGGLQRPPSPPSPQLLLLDQLRWPHIQFIISYIYIVGPPPLQYPGSAPGIYSVNDFKINF